MTLVATRTGHTRRYTPRRNVESEACSEEEYNVFVVACLPRRTARANYTPSNAIRFSIGYAKSIMSSEAPFPLDIDNLKVISQTLDSKGNIIITVASICTKTTCHKCGKDATKRYGYASLMEYRHTSVFDTPVILRIKPVRYECEHCEAGTTTTERYDWVAEERRD